MRNENGAQHEFSLLIIWTIEGKQPLPLPYTIWEEGNGKQWKQKYQRILEGLKINRIHERVLLDSCYLIQSALVYAHSVARTLWTPGGLL